MKFWYVPIESLNSRYTSQLCESWMPTAFHYAARQGEWTWNVVHPPEVSQEIQTGSVLDAVNRGIVSLSQMTTLLSKLEHVTSNDVIFFQDFWTPGIEALLYALHLQGKRPRLYAMCHAQSVDEYDFTYPMRAWMRPIELGWSQALSGLFVASTLHRDQLKAAGVQCPIHVVGLPIDAHEVKGRMDRTMPKQKQVIFCSRLNTEKNPHFMVAVAAAFLMARPDFKWVVTTSAQQFTSEVPGLLESCQELEKTSDGQFQMKAGLTKNEYYAELRRSAIQFNCSLQDYVSWCLLEASLAGCDLCYPDFRSFPECVEDSRRYKPFLVQDALRVLYNCLDAPETHRRTVGICHSGRLIEMAIMLRNWQGPEVNVWHQPQDYFIRAGLL